MDSMTSCELLTFLNAYLDYHQISLTTDDEEKTSFITPFRIFYYMKMAFGLKNGRGGAHIRNAYTSSWKTLKPTLMI
jgi:hypothetical protein